MVTGLGVVCALGTNVDEYWDGLAQGRCAIRPLTLFDPERGCRIAGEVLSTWAGHGSEAATRATRFAVAAATEALHRSAIRPGSIQPGRVGVVMGTCQGTPVETGEPEDRDRHPWAMQSIGDEVAAAVGAEGPRWVVSTACAAGANALGIAADLLTNDEADVVLAGGADSLSYATWMGFSVLHALDDDPCAPYSRSGGLSLGEGAAVFVMETLDHATARGADMHAEFLGYGLSADAHSPTAPDPTGRGAVLAMERALTDAGAVPDDLDYVNGHGTGTLANDRMERAALGVLLGERAAVTPVSATKSMIGHTLGAAGALEAAACLFALERGLLPPTANFGADASDELDFVPNTSRPARIRTAMSNSYAFGGNNVSVILGRSPRSRQRRAGGAPTRAVAVTGLGVVSALGAGVRCVEEASARDTPSPPAGLPPLPQNGRGVAPPNAWRRMDDFSRYLLVAVQEAWADSGLERGAALLERTGLIVGTSSGPIATIERFNRSVREGGPVNPVVFSNAALCAPAGHVCTVLGFRGPTSTVTSGGVAGLHALAYGAGLVRRGRADVVIVAGAEQHSPTSTRAAAEWPGVIADGPPRPFDVNASGTVFGSGFAVLVLESLERARARGAHIHGHVLGSSMASGSSRASLIAPSAAGFDAAIRQAVERSQLSQARIGYCMAAAAGIAAFDDAEAEALARRLPPRALVSAPASQFGYCLGAAGLLNALTALVAFRTGTPMPTANLDRPSPAAGQLLHAGAGSPRHSRQPSVALVNATSIGCTYASVLLADAIE